MRGSFVFYPKILLIIPKIRKVFVFMIYYEQKTDENKLETGAAMEESQDKQTENTAEDNAADTEQKRKEETESAD